MKNKPEYWYNQSAVVPFRINNAITEILIITTKKKKKWIIPKGIVELHLSASESAVKEAFEEAGVKGKVIPKKLGNYSYKKWGGNCRVKVYALEVTTIFDVWDENFRERKWIEISSAEKYINEKEVLNILTKLDEYVKNNY